MKTKDIFIAAGCVALNLSLAKVAALLSLPVYLDTIGTIIGAAVLPWQWALAVGGSTSILGAFLINPYWAAYIGTQLTIAGVAILCARIQFLATWWKALISGMLIAVSAVIVSAPITVILFGGVTLSGTTAINAVLLAAGNNIWKSVIGGSFVIESIDKPAAALVAWLTLRRLPENFKKK